MNLLLGKVTTAMPRYLRAKRQKITGGLIISLAAMWLSFAIAPCALAAEIAERPHHCLHIESQVGQSHHVQTENECPHCDSLNTTIQESDHLANPLSFPSYQLYPLFSDWTYLQPCPANQYLPKTVPVGHLPVHSTLQFRVLLI
ncbi:MAG: hypothetical protein V3W33_02140 [Gammaproteobacteria bacterium]|jgi:Zn finger protein HypA/HybF involved in hydrogenase expression